MTGHELLNALSKLTPAELDKTVYKTSESCEDCSEGFTCTHHDEVLYIKQGTVEVSQRTSLTGYWEEVSKPSLLLL